MLLNAQRFSFFDFLFLILSLEKQTEIRRRQDYTQTCGLRVPQLATLVADEPKGSNPATKATIRSSAFEKRRRRESSEAKNIARMSSNAWRCDDVQIPGVQTLKYARTKFHYENIRRRRDLNPGCKRDRLAC